MTPLEEVAAERPAAHHEATRRALAMNRRICLLACLCGTVLVLAWAMLALDVFGEVGSERPPFGLVAMGCAGILAGLAGIRQNRRARSILREHPWRIRIVEASVASRSGRDVLLRHPGTGDSFCVRLPLPRQRTLWTPPVAYMLPGAEVWWAGTPEKGGILSTPDGDRLVPIGPATHPALTSVDTAGVGGTAGVHRRRHRYRWILLISLIAVGLGAAGSTAADHDPEVELTVIDGSTAPGPCRVRLMDPTTHSSRTARFVCQGHRDPIIPRTEYGWVVSRGPWKGDLYNSDLQGSTGNDVIGGLLVVGLLGSAVGAIGGSVSYHHRKRYAHLAVAAAPRTRRAPPCRPRPCGVVRPGPPRAPPLGGAMTWVTWTATSRRGGLLR